MNQEATIVRLQPPEKQKLSPREEEFLALLSNIIVEQTIKQVYEKRDSLPPLQQCRSE